MKIQKRGLSAIVASVLLILLTISAVAIVANFIIPFADKSLESTECFKFRDYFAFDESFNYNCYDNNNNRYVLTIKARADNSSSEKVLGFKLRFLGGGNAISVDGLSGDPAGDLAMFDNVGNGKIIVPSPGGRYSALSYNYSSNYNYEKVEVYPVLEGGRVCDVSDSIKMIDC